MRVGPDFDERQVKLLCQGIDPQDFPCPTLFEILERSALFLQRCQAGLVTLARGCGADAGQEVQGCFVILCPALLQPLFREFQRVRAAQFIYQFLWFRSPTGGMICAISRSLVLPGFSLV